MDDKKLYQTRKWLNPVGHYDTGAIAASVVVDSYSVDAAIDLWDCGRKISLNFNFCNEKEAKQRANKIKVMREVLEEFEKALGEAYVLWNEKPDSTTDVISYIMGEDDD